MDYTSEQTVPYKVPLLRRPKKQTPKPERMSRRTAKCSDLSNAGSPPSNPSTAIPNPRTPNDNVAKSRQLDWQTITTLTIHDRRDKSGINQNESTILPQAPTNSPTKSPSDQGEGTADFHPLEPRGPVPFFPRNKKVFNTQASIYAQLFSSPSPPSREHFTLNEFQFFAKHRPSFPFSNTTVIKSFQNYKKLTSWLEAFPPSQATLNTLKLEVDVETPQVRIPKHQYLLGTIVSVNHWIINGTNPLQIIQTYAKDLRWLNREAVVNEIKSL